MIDNLSYVRSNYLYAIYENDWYNCWVPPLTKIFLSNLTDFSANLNNIDADKYITLTPLQQLLKQVKAPIKANPQNKISTKVLFCGFAE